MKVRITLLKETKQSCSISIFGDIVPMGKDLSNQGAVHRAFMLVVDELRGRYGVEDQGLLAGLFTVVKTFPTSNPESPLKSPPQRRPSPRKSPPRNRVKHQKSFPSAGNSSPNEERVVGIKQSANSIVQCPSDERPSSNPSFVQPKTEAIKTPQRPEVQRKQERPSTPSVLKDTADQKDNFKAQPVQQWSDFVEWDDAFADMPMDESFGDIPMDEDFGDIPMDESPASNRTIDVKPLPKLRLDLMPAPREEDEDEVSAM